MTDATGPEIWFYHLERSTLDQVLPELLGRTLQRGWRALVRVAEERRLEDIDERLWTFREDSFLAHGRADEPNAARQPILLTTGTENPNAADALFLVDGAEPGELDAFKRCVVLFDGGDDDQLRNARAQWSEIGRAHV